MRPLFRLNFRGLVYFKLILFFFMIFIGLFFFGVENHGFYYTITGLFVLSLVFIFINRFSRIPEQIQASLKIGLDSLFENILILYSGGLDSPFIFLLILDLFFGAYVLSAFKMLILSALVSAFYAIFTTLSYFGFLPSFLIARADLIPSPEIYFYYAVLMRVIIFFTMGYLASELSRRLSSQRARLEQMQHLTEHILFQMQTGLVTVDSEGHIIYANKAASSLLGIPLDILIECEWKSVFYQGIQDSKEELLYKQIYEGERSEILFKRRDGKQIPLGFSISEFIDEEMRIHGNTIVFRDLTLYKEMERLLLEQRKMKTVGELAATMAHEIKNPLASICGSLEVLKETQTFVDVKSKKMVDVILKESERLARTLSEFLTFSSELNLRLQKKDLKVLIEEVLMLLGNHSDKRPEINLGLRCEGKKEFIAEIDEDYFKQVIHNLVLNGIQSIVEGTGSVTVNLKHSIQANRFIVEVVDTGKGVSDEVRKDLFKPFFTTRSKGIGLGLNICQKISEKHGWELGLQPSFPKGSIFTLNIPLKG